LKKRLGDSRPVAPMVADLKPRMRPFYLDNAEVSL